MLPLHPMLRLLLLLKPRVLLKFRCCFFSLNMLVACVSERVSKWVWLHVNVYMCLTCRLLAIGIYDIPQTIPMGMHVCTLVYTIRIQLVHHFVYTPFIPFFEPFVFFVSRCVSLAPHRLFCFFASLFGFVVVVSVSIPFHSIRSVCLHLRYFGVDLLPCQWVRTLNRNMFLVCFMCLSWSFVSMSSYHLHYRFLFDMFQILD